MGRRMLRRVTVDDRLAELTAEYHAAERRLDLDAARRFQARIDNLLELRRNTGGGACQLPPVYTEE